MFLQTRCAFSVKTAQTAQHFSETLPPEPSLGLPHKGAAKLTVLYGAYGDSHINCKTILWSFSMKFNIRKLDLFQKRTLVKLPG